MHSTVRADYWENAVPHPNITEQNYLESKEPYLQNLKRIFSKTNTGPVLPSIVRGCPANNEYAIPVIEAPKRDSIAL